MKCWICGEDDANTREHKNKASDLRSEFGVVTQKEPLYYHIKYPENDKPTQIKICSLKADILKFDHEICHMCNSTRTQPYDRAWETFSSSMRPLVLKQKKVRCNKIFSYDTRRCMLNLHLYFVKLFGCHIVDNKIPISIESFSKAILDKKAHPNLYLSFGHFGISNGKYSGCSEIQCDLLNGEVAFASWFYQVGTLVVNILYAIPGERRYGLIDAWHPTKALCLNVKDFIS